MLDLDTLNTHRLDDDGAPPAPACDSCQGTGRWVAENVHCQVCGGTGRRERRSSAVSYCVWCWDRKRRPDGSEPDAGATNALRFATKTEAESYAADLYSRWMGLDHYEVRESADPVNYRWVDGRAQEIR